MAKRNASGDRYGIDDQVDRAWDEQVNFLRSLVGHRSVLGNTNGVLKSIEQTTADLGLSTDRVQLNVEDLHRRPGFSQPAWSYEGLFNVVARLRGSGGGRSLVLNGHVDVVPSTPDEHWKHEPWVGEVDANRMYGRGAADMKGGLSAIVYALRAIREAGIRLRGDVVTQFVIDEECTGNGTLACLAAGYVADAAIIPEPFGLAAVSAHPGVLWARVRVRGRAAHAAFSQGAINSIEKMVPIIKALRALEAALNEEGPQRHPAFQAIAHPLNFNFGQLHSGDWTSTVPELSTLDVRFSCWPGEDLAKVQHRFEQTIAAAGREDEWLREVPPQVEYYGFRAEGVVYDLDTAIAGALGANHARLAGRPLDRTVVTATVDNRFFSLYFGIPSVCYGPAGGNLHAPDEWVDLESLAICTKAIAGTVIDWCGVE